MKKFAILAIAIMLLPIAANAVDLTYDGDAGFYNPFPGGTIEVIKGQTWCYLDPDGYADLGPANFGFLGYCPDADTFCVDAWDDLGWDITNDGFDCWLLDAGYIHWVEVCITVPCTATPGMTNTLYAKHAFCDYAWVCQPDSGDCVDPSYWGTYDINIWQNTEQDFLVVESPPSLFIMQDTLYFVEQGQTGAYVPFSICNGDACAPDITYGYTITSKGWVGDPLNQEDTADLVPGGECEAVYGIVDAGLADPCDYDTLTIIAWQEDGSVYDTCVQRIHVIEPLPVPLFTAPVVTILVLAMILAAAVIMKRHAVSKA